LIIGILKTPLEGIIMKPKIILAIFLVLLGLMMTTPLIAADVLHRLTHNDQYALVLG
jgi:hypothetical protein